MLAWLLIACGSSAATGQTRGDPGADLLPEIVFIPTTYDIVSEMLKLAEVSKEDTVYDLGCGDGRIVVAAADKVRCRGIGYDIDPHRVREARRNAIAHQVEHLVRIEERDLFTVDLREATVVMLYLGTQPNARLLPQLERLPAGARIVSHQFPLPGQRPDKVVHQRSREDGHRHTLFLWTAPLVRGP
jgi:SAM-dependent methyltransferase